MSTYGRVDAAMAEAIAAKRAWNKACVENPIGDPNPDHSVRHRAAEEFDRSIREMNKVIAAFITAQAAEPDPPGRTGDTLPVFSGLMREAFGQASDK